MMAKEISRLLSQRAEEIARYLLPNGKKEGNEWRAGSVSGEAGYSLGVHLSGEKAGLWCDFSNASDKGDLIDLWALARKLSFSETINEAARYLGVSDHKFEGHKPAIFTKPKQQAASILSESSPVMAYLINERKLTVETIHAFKINAAARKIIFPYWRDGELIFVKYLGLDRIDGKKQISVETGCEPCLFGWHLMPPNSRTVTICEGEIDAMTLYQYGLPVLSVPFGGGIGDKHKWIEHEFDRLSIFDEIFLCFDNDPVGEASLKELVTRLGRHRCRIVRLPKKDANECLQSGIAKEEIHNCFASSRTLDPVELKSAYEYTEDVIDLFYPSNGVELGYHAPWEKVQGKILFRPDELSAWTGINGHGKSQFLGHLILSMMKQGGRVCIASLELKPKRLLYRLTRQAGALMEPTESYIHVIHDWYKDKLWIFDLVGTAKIDRLLEVFLYARQRYGVDVFVIDSFMKLDIAEDDYKAQKMLAEKLCDFKNQYNCHIHVVIHPRKGMDESQPPGKLDMKGTGALSDLADNCFTVWRNKAKESVVQIKASGRALSSKQAEMLKDADCFWCCDKQRNGDWEGRFGFWFHSASLQYLSHENHKPYIFVDYSNQNVRGS